MENFLVQQLNYAFCLLHEKYKNFRESCTRDVGSEKIYNDNAGRVGIEKKVSYMKIINVNT